MEEKTYYRINIFAKESVGGGIWEPDTIVSGDTPEKAYKEVLKVLQSIKYAYEISAELCDKDGDILE